MNPYQINVEIEKLVQSKEVFTAEEMNFIGQYTGMGGLEKYGARGNDLLYEYYTPNDLIRVQWALAVKYGFIGGKVLEPSCGVGRVFNYDRNKAVGYEINPLTAKICKILNPHVDVRLNPFSEHFYDKKGQFNPDFEKDYDLAIGNPPYSEIIDINQESEIALLKLKRLRFDQYFIIRSLDCLKPGGLLVFVVTDNLFRNSYPEVEAAILQRADLLDAYLLPDKTFKTTKQPTSLIVLQKKIKA